MSSSNDTRRTSVVCTLVSPGRRRALGSLSKNNAGAKAFCKASLTRLADYSKSSWLTVDDQPRGHI